MNDIKPIETWYNGVKYRSQLEAYWAIAFDELGLGCSYEPRLFSLQGGVGYLPDFYSEKLSAYIEIKPGLMLIGREEAVKILGLAAKGESLLLLCGPPWEHHSFVLRNSARLNYARLIEEGTRRGFSPEQLLQEVAAVARTYLHFRFEDRSVVFGTSSSIDGVMRLSRCLSGVRHFDFHGHDPRNPSDIVKQFTSSFHKIADDMERRMP